MSADQAVCFVSAVAFGALLVLPATPEPKVPIVRNDYRIAEQLGCVEVLRVCHAKMKSTSIRKAQWHK